MRERRKHRGEEMIELLRLICNKILITKQWPSQWTRSILLPLPKKGNLKLCANYRTISLISTASKVMLKVIVKRLRPQAEAIISEEQAGFRKNRKTAEQIFNLRILCENISSSKKKSIIALSTSKKHSIGCGRLPFGKLWKRRTLIST